MCGICGIVAFEGSPPVTSVVAAMTATLSHRGPDDHGVEVRGPVGLGHTRLSIIDLSDAGHQPMHSADGEITLVYNGEIYNFRELRKQLADLGVSFRGHSDSEVVLEAYRRWGLDAIGRFEGMFALAVWNGLEQRLHLARDRFGIKPLFYADLSGGIVFGSEIKALLASERVERKMSWTGLHEYLYFGTALGEHTLFEGVREVLPGHVLTVDRSGTSTRAFWSVEDVKPVAARPDEAAAEIQARLERAVESHLVADVPVGVFLSGGIDSSAITAFASRHYPGKLATYSVGFDFDRGVNELPKARAIADHFQTDHHELHVAGTNMSDTIEKLVRCHDQPFGDAANLPLYLLCEQLRGSVKVILQGDGGDEIFAGYRRYNVLSQPTLWRWASRVGSPLFGLFSGNPQFFRGKRFLEAVGQSDSAMRMALLLTEEGYGNPPTRVLTGDATTRLARSDAFARYRELDSRLAHLDPIQRMLHTDCAILLPNDFLEKVDKSTMAHGIEVRVPFLDSKLTEYAMGLPSSLKVRSGQKKWILRRALRGVVPDSVLDGPKTGFGVPYGYWLREPLAEYMRSVLFDPSVLAHGVFDEPTLRACVDDHTSGRRDSNYLLYKLLNLALWQKEYSVAP